MTRITSIFVSGLAVVALGTTLLAAQQPARSAEALMGAAQHAEDVDGNLEAALAAYQKVTTAADASRSLKARALLQIGRLLEKRGAQDARRTYERITREFADQGAVVSEARTRLAALTTAAAPADETQVVARQVWAGAGVDAFGSLSPDSRTYAYVDWSTTATGNLALRTLQTGESRLLTNLLAIADGFAQSPAWSSDGRRLAYVWSGAGTTPAELRIIGIDGKGERSVFRRQDTYTDEIRWSPDDRRLVILTSTYGSSVTGELAVIDAESGATVLAKPQGSRALSLGGFSPDGTRLVYGVIAQSAGETGGIYALDIASGRETALVAGPGHYSDPTWTPDGQSLVFASDRSGAPGLWRLDTASPSSSMQPQLLKPNVGQITGLHVGRDGAVWYGLVNLESDVYLADFDPAAMVVKSTPVRLSTRFIGANSGPAWAPDGQSLAFMRGTSPRKRTVVVRRLADGQEAELPNPFVDTVHASNWGPTWLPDGRALLVSDVNFGTGKFTVHRMSVGSSEVHPEFEGDFARAWPHVRTSPDGRSLYFTRRLAEPSIDRGSLVLVRRDRVSGAETELYKAPSLGAVGFFGIALSPDGKFLAFGQNVGKSERQLVLVPTDGGPALVLYRGTTTMPLPGTGAFTADGRYVLVAGRTQRVRGSAGSAVSQLWAIPVTGGEPRPVGLERRGGIGSVTLSPDGTRLAFAANERSGELWSIRNLLRGARHAGAPLTAQVRLRQWPSVTVPVTVATDAKLGRWSSRTTTSVPDAPEKRPVPPAIVWVSVMVAVGKTMTAVPAVLVNS